MPIYEYGCEKCKQIVECIQSSSNPKPPEKCNECGSNAMVKLVSNSSFVLKGGGWYKDGYSKEGSSSAKPPSSGSDN